MAQDDHSCHERHHWKNSERVSAKILVPIFHPLMTGAPAVALKTVDLSLLLSAYDVFKTCRFSKMRLETGNYLIKFRLVNDSIFLVDSILSQLGSGWRSRLTRALVSAYFGDLAALRHFNALCMCYSISRRID